MSECQPRLSGVHVFIPSSKSFLVFWFLVSLACLLCGRPALAQQPLGCRYAHDRDRYPTRGAWRRF